jgi:hypothetical protein
VRITWDPPKAAANPARHQGVTFEEASEVFAGDPLILPDHAHSEGEYRFHAIGASSRRVLLVVWTEPAEDVVHIISAWPASPAQRRAYRAHLKGTPP